MTEWMNERINKWMNETLAEWLTEWTTEGLTSWLTEFANVWLPGCVGERPIEWLLGGLSYLFTDWLTRWIADWLTVWLFDWQGANELLDEIDHNNAQYVAANYWVARRPILISREIHSRSDNQRLSWNLVRIAAVWYKERQQHQFQSVPWHV